MALFGRPTHRDHQRADAWREWIHRQYPPAIVSFVLGVFSLVDFGVLVLPALVSIALGTLALRRLHDDRALDGTRLAWTGILLSALSLIVAVGVYLKGLQ